MNEARAKRIARELEGKEVGGWTVTGELNFGKSAVVLQAKKDGEEVALKIFDPDLVEAYGKETQLERIRRETTLIGIEHPYLVQIKGGGECPSTGYLYVAMERLPYSNLAQKLIQIPRDFVAQIVCQIALAAKFLEDLGLVHRDIKPENIVISDDFEHAILLDLGVLRPVGLSNLTDNEEQRSFLGTLQYSPPELLYRKEKDSIEGWRAITFYQLGAVLHDLIMKRPIFAEECQPYAQLVNAVSNKYPEIRADDIPDYLKMLVRSCLLKDPQKRLSLVRWDKFLSCPIPLISAEKLLDNIKEKQVCIKANINDISNMNSEVIDMQNQQRLQSVTSEIESIIRNTCVSRDDYFPRVRIDHRPVMDGNNQKLLRIIFESSSEHALSHSTGLFLWVTFTDYGQEIVVIEYKAYVGCDIGDADPKATDTEILFQGVFDVNIVHERLTLMLLALIDKSLMETEELHENKETPTNVSKRLLLNLGLS